MCVCEFNCDSGIRIRGRREFSTFIILSLTPKSLDDARWRQRWRRQTVTSVGRNRFRIPNFIKMYAWPSSRGFIAKFLIFADDYSCGPAAAATAGAAIEAIRLLWTLGPTAKAAAADDRCPRFFQIQSPHEHEQLAETLRGQSSCASTKLYGYARSLLGTLCVCVCQKGPENGCGSSWLARDLLFLSSCSCCASSLVQGLTSSPHSFAEGYACCARVRSIGRSLADWLGSLQGRSIHSFIRPLMLPSICRVSSRVFLGSHCEH